MCGRIIDMKLLKKVDKIKVKQDFLLSDIFTFKRENVLDLSKYLPTIDIEKITFSKDFEEIKKKVLKLNESTLDKIIYDESPPRLAAFNKVAWYLGYVDSDEVGIWRGAGGLPDEWTKGSVKETVDEIMEKTNSLKTNLHLLNNDKRVIRAVPYIIRFKDIIQNNDYFLPIILPGGTMGREGLELMKGDINDGCMRSIAYVLSGETKIRAYIGRNNNN